MTPANEGGGELLAVGLALIFASIGVAIVLAFLGIQNPLTDFWSGLMAWEACSVGSMRPGLCGGP